MIQKKKFFEKGQGIVEYVLVTALVALATVAVFKTFRADINEAYRKAGKALVQGVDDGVSSSSPNE
jgi:Flp pilus assembly pilin Flp